jgi:NADH-quinone oxidoreductase subunit C
MTDAAVQTTGASPAPGPGGGGSPAVPDPVTAHAGRRLRERIPGSVLEESLLGRHPFLRVDGGKLVEIATFLRDDPELRFDCCHLVSSVDWPAKTPAEGAGSIDVVYHLVSYAKKSDVSYRRRAEKNDPFLVLKVRVPRDKPDVPSVMTVWAGADWHERETYDLMGVHFTGRGHVRRILLPEDWPGHPLRKDWEYPAEYHGIPIIPPEGR